MLVKSSGTKILNIKTCYETLILLQYMKHLLGTYFLVKLF